MARTSDEYGGDGNILFREWDMNHLHLWDKRWRCLPLKHSQTRISTAVIEGDGDE